MRTRYYISLVLFMMFNAVLFGTGLLLTLALSQSALVTGIGITLTVIVSIALGGYLAWRLAPRVRAPFWNRRDEAPKPVWR